MDASAKDLERSVNEALEQAVRLGYVEQVGVDGAREALYRLTERGAGYVEGLLAAGHRETATLMANMMRRT